MLASYYFVIVGDENVRIDLCFDMCQVSIQIHVSAAQIYHILTL